MLISLQKSKVDVNNEVPATPEKQKPKAKSEVKTPKTPATSSETPKKTPAKRPSSVTFNKLATEGVATVPISVEVEGDSGHAIQRKANNFGQILKLSASETFSVVKTVRGTSALPFDECSTNLSAGYDYRGRARGMSSHHHSSTKGFRVQEAHD